jgi:hypothetical protein
VKQDESKRWIFRDVVLTPALIDWLIDTHNFYALTWLNLVVFFLSPGEAPPPRPPGARIGKGEGLGGGTAGTGTMGRRTRQWRTFWIFSVILPTRFNVLGILGAFWQDRADRCGVRMGWHQYLIVFKKPVCLQESLEHLEHS